MGKKLKKTLFRREFERTASSESGTKKSFKLKYKTIFVRMGVLADSAKTMNESAK